jgi:hypothetical protein
MKEREPFAIEKLEDRIAKIEFLGNRNINEFIDSWLGIRNVIDESCTKLLVVDNMKGAISAEGICLLIEMLSEYKFYEKKKIAVVLAESNAYSPRFFDVIARNWGINTKHFTCETEALEWLGKEIPGCT